MAEEKKILEKLKERRLYKYWAGVVLFYGGLLLAFADVLTSFPTVQHGLLGLKWLLLCIPGFVIWFMAKKLPIDEALWAAEKNDFILTAPMLSKELDIKISTAEKTLQFIESRGYAHSTFHPEKMTTVYSFETLRAQLGKGSSAPDYNAIKERIRRLREKPLPEKPKTSETHEERERRQGDREPE